MRKYFFFIAAAVLLLDRLAKWAVASSLPLPHNSVTVIPGFFCLTHVENTGAAFGLFAESTSQWKIGALVSFSIIALMVVSALLWKHSHSLSTTTIGLSLILGGATGNLWDRMMTGHVVDFLDFYVGSYHWPAFNVADSAIVIGAILLVSEIVFAKSGNEAVKSSS
jgi:signal peptidase II